MCPFGRLPCSSLNWSRKVKTSFFKKASQKTLRVSDPTRTSSFVVPTRKEAPTGNVPLQRTQTSPIPGRLADQVPVSGRCPSEHSGSGRPNPDLGVENKSGKIRAETYSGVFILGILGYEYHLDSALV